jgi:hypothetical protein
VATRWPALALSRMARHIEASRNRMMTTHLVLLAAALELLILWRAL